MDILTLLGHSISVADVAAFVANWILPAVSGVFVSWFTNRWKIELPLDIPDGVRVGMIRVFVALLCTVLNFIGQWAMTGSAIDMATVPTLFYSYATAAAAYDHLFKKK